MATKQLTDSVVIANMKVRENNRNLTRIQLQPIAGLLNPER
ncbi:hypothetical protein [Brevibacillus borstelensis]|nr:hypothetical protein [Brevibacillus borstelensis]MED2007028.1 hypothetical protein [Brevibacillus borstelensis]